MQRNAKTTVLTVVTLFAAGCARSDFARSGKGRSFWNTAGRQKDVRAVQAPPPKILPETYFAAARLHETQGQFSQAIVQYRKAIAVNHRYVEAYHRMGMLLGATGQFAEASKALYRAVQLSPEDAILRNNLGFQLLMEENWNGARRAFERAIELRPGFARAHVNLGLVLSKLGHFDEALEQFQSVLPEADAYYNLGLMYRSQKRYEDAASAYRRTLELDPDFQAARTQLEQLAVHLAPVTPVESAEAAPVVSTHVPPEVIEPESSDAVADMATVSAAPIEPVATGRPAEESAEAATVSMATNGSDTDVADEGFGAFFFDMAITESADEHASAPCESTSQLADENFDESPFFGVDAVNDASPTPFEQAVRPAPVENVQNPKMSEIAANDSIAGDVPVETVRPTQTAAPVAGVSGRCGLTSLDAMDVYDVISHRSESVEVGPPAPGELLVCTARNRNASRLVELDGPICSEDACWLEQSFEEPERPCDARFVGERWTDHEVDPTERRLMADTDVARFWNDMVDVRPTIPLAGESIEPGHNVTMRPVPEQSEPVRVVAVEPAEVIALPPAKVVHVATTAATGAPIECFADDRPSVVCWNDLVPEEDYCVDRGALFREFDKQLEVVRAEIRCLDEALMDEVYRVAAADRTQPDQSSTDVSLIEPQEPFVEFSEPELVSSDSMEPVSPAGPMQGPILIREEWEESIAEPIKKEPAARLTPVPAVPESSFDGNTAAFDDLVGLCSIVENEMECLAELHSDDRLIVSPAFDPTVETKLPPYVPFDLLLSFIWDTPVIVGEDLVCVADPPLCLAEDDHRQAASIHMGASDPNRRPNVVRRTYSTRQ